MAKNKFLTKLAAILGLLICSFAGLPVMAGTGALCSSVFSRNVSAQANGAITLHFYDEAGRPADNLNSLLSLLNENHPGIQIDFGNGLTLDIASVVAKGGSSFFATTTDGRFVKVFVNSLINAERGANLQVSYFSAEGFAQSQRELEADGVRVVGIKESHLPYFIEVERLPLKYTLQEFKYIANKLSLREQHEAEERLVEWAKSTWRYQSIGDFNDSQIGYTGSEWVLFDFGNRNERVLDLRQSGNIFDPINDQGLAYNVVDPELYRRIERAIRDERLRNLAARHTALSAEPWISRPAKWLPGPPNRSSYLFRREISSARLIGAKLSISPNLLRKSDLKALIKTPVTGEQTWYGIPYTVKKIKRVGDDSVLFKISFASGKTGWLEVATQIREAADEFKVGTLLKKAGYGKSEWSASGPDYVLVIEP